MTRCIPSTLIHGFVCLIVLAIFARSAAEPVTVAWDPNSETDLAGYKVYVGEQTGIYTGEVDVGTATQFSWNNLEDNKTYFFAVRAYDFSGNISDFSAEVSATTGNSDPNDTNPPDLINVLVQGETQLDLIFSEPLDEESARNINNYKISDGVGVVGAVLDPGKTVVHLITSAHGRGRTYVITISDVTDLAGNAITNGRAKSYQIPNPDGDLVAPQLSNVVVADVNQLLVVFSEPVSQETAEDKNNYQIDNGITIVQAVLTNNQSIVRLITDRHANEVTYRLTVSNIKDVAGNEIVANSAYSYDVNLQEVDSSAPELLTVVVNGATQIDLNFDEPVAKTSAENESNYVIDGGIEVLGAILDDNLTTVHLITTPHIEDKAYKLKVSNISDVANNPNIISADTELAYVFEKGRVGPPADNVLPQTFALFQNYPNPFNPETEIRFFLEKQRKVELKVYNPLGQLVKTLLEDEMPNGFHTIVWNGTNKDNIQVPSGIYIYSLEVKRKEQKGDLLVEVSLERRVKRMTLVR